MTDKGYIIKQMIQGKKEDVYNLSFEIVPRKDLRIFKVRSKKTIPNLF